MQAGDFPHQRKSQPYAAIFAAAGLIYTKKGLEDAALKLFGDTAAGIAYANRKFCWCLEDRDVYCAVRAVVFDGVFCQVEQQPVE